LLGMCILGCVYFGLSTAVVEDVCPSPDSFAEDILGEEMWMADDFVITDVMDPAVCLLDDAERQCSDCPQSLFFVRSVYFLMQTLFTIGYGDSVVPSKSVIEMSLACIFMVAGVFGYGLIIANLTSVLANLDVVSMRFRHEMDALNRWLSFRCTPESLRERVNLCFMYFSRTQHGMLDDALLADLPPHLCSDLAELHLDMVTKIPFFNRSLRSDSFLSRIATSLIRRVYAPGSYILYQDEKQREMVVIKRGRADICIKHCTDPVGSLLPGDYMGDYQLLFGTVNQVGLRASDDFCEVLVLTYSRFEAVMSHPDCSDMMFQARGCNFRESSDQGALDTIERSREELNKILVAISNITTKEKSDKLKDMMEKTQVTFKGFRIQPDSLVHVAWDVFALLAIMYYSVSCPVRLAAYIGSNSLQSSFDMLFILDYAIDVLFLTDMFLRTSVYAYVSYASGRNEVIVDRRLIQRQYLQSGWFPVDFLCSIPLDLVSLATGYYAVYRIPKLARILQLSRLISRLQKNLDECVHVTMNETQMSSLIMFMYSVLIVVWSSAGWNALREGESVYHSVYWAFTTLTTVGYGDLTPTDYRETCYALFVGAAGATFSAAIIANVTSFFHNAEISEDSTEHKLTVVKSFMERLQCQREHINKVEGYFEYIEREQDGVNEDIMLNRCIPDNIKSDMLIHITQSMVLNCGFFASCESGFIRRLMLSLEQRFFGKQYMIMTDSTPADGMYFVKKGTVEILERPDSGRAEAAAPSRGAEGITVGSSSTALKVKKRLEADDSFAEGCLLLHWESNPFMARAADDCELWFLSRSTFNRIVIDFPLVRKLLREREAGLNLVTSNERRASANAILKAAEKARRKRAFFIHPDKHFFQAWAFLVLLVTLYNTLVLPLRVAFFENHVMSSTWVALDYLGDICLLADVVMRGAFLAFYDDNHLVIDRSKIFSHYRKSKLMKWHVLAFLPLEIIAVIVPTTSMCPLWTMQVVSLFRQNKLFRLSEIGTLLSQVETSVSKAGMKLPRNQLRVSKLIMVILISAHLVGCLFFMIANFNQHASGGDESAQNNWANTEGLLDAVPTCPGEAVDANTIWQRYITAMYWAMATVTTVGYGDVTANENSTAEIIFSTFVLVIGTAIYTLVIALLEDIVAQLDVTSTLYETKLNAVELYMGMQGLPEDIKLKITAYYENLWRHQLGIKGGKILKYLPRSLRSDLLFETLSPLLQQTFFLKDCSADFVASILRTLSLELYLADDVIFQEGERGDKLSFLFRGEVDLLTSSNVKFKTVADCLLGESSFFGFEPYICTAKAATVCELFHLDMKKFLDNIRDNHLLERFASYLECNEKSLAKSKGDIVKMIKNLNSSKMAKMLNMAEIRTTPNGVILPNSAIRQAWDTAALFFLMVLVFKIPYQISFPSSDNGGGDGGGIGLGQFIVDCIIDLFFVADIYAKVALFAKMKDGVLFATPKIFRKLYFQGAGRMDIVSAVPASLVSYLMGRRGRAYGLLRLFQLVRTRHLGPYLDDAIELYATKTGKALSTAFLRIAQMFLGVLLLCHYCACIFHLIADVSSSPSNWLVEDGTAGERVGVKYLRAFYWSLYTTSTIGYGSISVISIGERLFAMATMVVGAVICDAGITAVLTSIIIRKDTQASTNNRRIQCSKSYMRSNLVNDDIRQKVLGYHSYADTQLHNIDEATVLQDLSPSLHGQVLAHFCFKPMRTTPLLEDFSDGALMSLVKLMKPYVAIPGERIVEAGKECNAIFVLQRGWCTIADSSISSSSGMEEETVHVPIGTIFGHEVTKAREESDGCLPTFGLKIEIIEAHGVKSKNSSPYMILECGSVTCRTSIKKNLNSRWQETVVLKVVQSEVDRSGKTISITINGWRRDGAHRLLGSGQMKFGREDTELHTVSLTDAFGKRAGTVNLRVKKYKLPKHEVPTSHEQTVTAHGYCHLYRMETFEISRLRDYLSRSKQVALLHQRPLLPPCRSTPVSSSIGNMADPDRSSFSTLGSRSSGTYEDVDTPGGEADEESSSSCAHALPDSPKQEQDLTSNGEGVAGSSRTNQGQTSTSISTTKSWRFGDKRRIAPENSMSKSQWTGAIQTEAVPLSPSNTEEDWNLLVDMSSIADTRKPRNNRNNKAPPSNSSRGGGFFVDWDTRLT